MTLPRKFEGSRVVPPSVRLRSKWISPVLSAPKVAPLSRDHRASARSTLSLGFLGPETTVTLVVFRRAGYGLELRFSYPP